MAHLTDRLPQNVPGIYFVDSTCTGCDLCRSLAPEFFSRDDETGFSFVHRQPVSTAEIERAEDALQSCPYESIGHDGVMVMPQPSEP